MLRNFKGVILVICLCFVIVLYGCNHKGSNNTGTIKNDAPTTSKDLTITPTQVPIKVIPKVADIKVLPDQSYKDFFTEDPYSLLSRYALSVGKPDRDLYNYLFHAAMKHEKTVDISSFKLKDKQIVESTGALFDQIGLQLFYIKNVKCSKDFKTVRFIYYKDEDAKDIKKDQDIFYSQMNHLLYNVAPSNYTPLQKLFSEFDYIAKYDDYTDAMDDQTTFSASSALINKKAICGGFSFLADYILNFVGVPSIYISNEAHAWNIVTLNGNRYHTDFTWGAGSANTNMSFLNTALMDDKERMKGLTDLGFGKLDIIEGYPGGACVKPQPCTNNQYEFLKDIYDNYALDIENNWIYYTSNTETNRIHLDGTGKETLLKQFVYPINVFEGILYYIGEDQGLYKLVPGESPVRMEQKINYDLKLHDGILSYTTDKNAKDIHKIDLNPFSIKAFASDTSNHMDPFQISKQQTFQIAVTFSEKMNQSKLPKDLIGLVDKDAKSIPITMSWDETGKTLYIRSKEYINQLSGVTLYVLAGLEDEKGNKMIESYDKSIKFTN